jgi:type II secretory pathway component PulM
VNGKNRERLTFIIGGIIGFIILYFSIFALPTMDTINKQKKQIMENEKRAGELKKLLSEHGGADQNQKKKFQGSLSAFVENKSKEIGVVIAYIRPYGDKGEGVEVKVDEMEGKKIIQFTYEMETNGIRVTRLNMRDYKGAGEWVVKFNLES